MREAKGSILITGASGLIGSALLPYLSANGYDVTRLVRSRATMKHDTRFWDPAQGVIELARTDDFDGVIHLAGANIGDRRLTEKRKREVWNSRVDGTTLLCNALLKLERKPRVLVCASAMGIYGDRGDEWLTEASAPGEGFLAELCTAWEQAAEPAQRAGIRVVHLRTAIVLSAAGGALKKMLPAFFFGLGGPLGNGEQWMSWITRADIVRLYLHSVETETLSGPVNAASNKPFRQRGFARALGRALHRPALIPVPRFALRAVFGTEMADSVLASTRLVPEQATRSGFDFQHAGLPEALSAALNDRSLVPDDQDIVK